MGYLYLLMGVIISAAVFPAALSLLWSKQNFWAATLSPILGFICSLIAWLVTAKQKGGELSVASTGANDPMLAGNVTALLSPVIFVPVLTYALRPDNYDWESMKQIRKGDDHDIAVTANVDLEQIPGERSHSIAESQEEQTKLLRAAKIARVMTVLMTVSLLVLWPMPMYGSSYIFSKPFFTGWVSVGILWLFCSSFAVGVYPLFEGRHTMKRTFMRIVRDITGKEKPNVMRGVVVEASGATPPSEKADEKEARAV